MGKRPRSDFKNGLLFPERSKIKVLVYCRNPHYLGWLQHWKHFTGALTPGPALQGVGSHPPALMPRPPSRPCSGRCVHRHPTAYKRDSCIVNMQCVIPKKVVLIAGRSLFASHKSVVVRREKLAIQTFGTFLSHLLLSTLFCLETEHLYRCLTAPGEWKSRETLNGTHPLPPECKHLVLF